MSSSNFPPVSFAVSGLRIHSDCTDTRALCKGWPPALDKQERKTPGDGEEIPVFCHCVCVTHGGPSEVFHGEGWLKEMTSRLQEAEGKGGETSFRYRCV